MNHEAGRVVARVVADTLRPHPPFSSMSEEALAWIGQRANLAYFPRGEEITGPSRGPVALLHIVKQGVVRVQPSEGMPNAEAADPVHGPGECFPVDALLGRRPPAYRYVAAGDVFTYELADADVRHLLDMSPAFRDFCTDRLAALVEQSRRALRSQAGEKVMEEGRLMSPLRAICSSPAVSCSPATSIRAALETMRDRRVGSMVVVDERNAPLGIFTNVDVLERVALAGRSLDSPIAEVMSAPALSLDAGAPAFAAAQLMAERAIRHVAVLEEGRLCGIVSERDLFALQRVSAGKVAKAIRAARDADSLVAAAAAVRELTGHLLAQGTSAAQLTALISSMNDALVQAAVRLEARRHALSGRYCWLAFGSEGRSEQTLATDQDNGLILEDGAEPRAFLPFALEVNRLLERCGFPLCKGGVMASNPRWCLTLSQWRATFSDWIMNPLPEALLNAAIFFDLRPLAGEPDFARELRDAILARTAGNQAFLRAMAGNALDSRPPLGLLGGFDTGDGGMVDLKAGGSRLFVDAARVWALARRVPATSTAERLLGAGLPADEAASAAEAFRVVQTLRLRRQFLEAPAQGEENRVAPRKLNAVDRRVLQEALRLAGRLQQRLRLDFAL